MNLRQVLLVLRLRWWLVLLVFALVVAAAAIVSKLQPKKYSAHTTLLLDVKTDPLLATLMPSLATPGYIATQIEIVQSDRIAGRVVKMLGLAENPAAVAQWREETEGRIPLDKHFGDMMQRGLQVEAGRGSTILTIGFVAADPKFAAAAANTFARAFIDLSVELRVGPAREYAGFFDERAKALRTDLEAAQAKLSSFQQKKGILVSAERLDMEMSRLTSLETALAGAMADSAETASRQRNAGTENSVDVQQSGAVQGLKAELARAETKLIEVSTNYGGNHPIRIQLDAQIAEIKQQITSEMRRVSGATSNVNRIAGQRIGELRTLVETQKRNVFAMRSERDEASLLLKELETAQRAYETVAQRRSQLANESQADQASARVLSPAVEPLTHSSPNIPKNMVAGVIVGLVLGLAAALGWEMLDRRIRSEADMFVGEGIPVLGVMSSSVGPTRVRRLPPMYPRPPMPPRLTLDGGSQ